jgi:hypothetical protein
MKASLLLNKSIYTMALVALGFSTFAQDVGVTAVIAPSQSNNLTFGYSYAVTVTIKNFGTSSIQDVPVKFAVGQNQTLLEIYGGVIAAGASYNYTFTDSLVITNTFVGNSFAQTELVGDVISSNDRIDWTYAFGATSIIDNLEDEVGDIKVYPNPVVDELSINYDGTGEADVNIYNMAGDLVLALGKYAGGTLNNINIAELSSGTYVVQVASESGTTYKKFVK